MSAIEDAVIKIRQGRTGELVNPNVRKVGSENFDTLFEDDDPRKRSKDEALTQDRGGELRNPFVSNQPYVDKIDGPGEAFSAGVTSGIRNLEAQTYNFRAAINALAGNEVATQNLLEEARRREADAGIPLSGMEQFDSVLEEPTVGGFFNQVAAATGQFVPSAFVSVVAAAATGGVAAGGAALTTRGGAAFLTQGSKAPFLRNLPLKLGI